MAVNLPIRDIPGALGAPSLTSLVAMDNGISMSKTTAQALVEAGRPAASQAEAQSGVENTKVMTALRVAQAVDAIGSSLFVPASRAIVAGDGLAGGGTLQTNRTMALSNASIASLARADTAVQPNDLGALATKNTVSNSDWSGLDLAVENGGTGASTADVARSNLGAASAAQGALADTSVQPARIIAAGTGLAGGGDLSQNRTVSLSPTSIASLGKADSAVQPNGSTGVVQIGTTDANNGALRMSRRTTGFNTSLEWLNSTGAAVGFLTRSEGGTDPYVVVRAANASDDSMRIYNDRLLVRSNGALQTVYHTANLPVRSITAGTGLTGGGDLSTDRTIALSSQTQSALVPAGGATGQTLVKTGAGDYAFAWQTPAGGGDMSKSENLAGLTDYAAARINLGLPDTTNSELDAGTSTGLRSLSVANLWRGARSAIASATADIAYRRGNIIGPVSQSGGTPLGAIIERGANSNGQWVRYADGTQIVWNLTANPILSTPTAVGQGFQSSAVSVVTLPIAFASPPAASPMNLFNQPTNGDAGTARAWASVATVSSSTVGLIAHSFQSTGACWGAYLAIGRWF